MKDHWSIEDFFKRIELLANICLSQSVINSISSPLLKRIHKLPSAVWEDLVCEQELIWVQVGVQSTHSQFVYMINIPYYVCVRNGSQCRQRPFDDHPSSCDRSDRTPTKHYLVRNGADHHVAAQCDSRPWWQLCSGRCFISRLCSVPDYAMVFFYTRTTIYTKFQIVAMLLSAQRRLNAWMTRSIEHETSEKRREAKKTWWTNTA